jgi:type I restriction enzyme M protein
MNDMTTQNTLTPEAINNVLWRACDTFRGKTDSSVYKDYILVMLFVKYLSDTYQEHYEEYSRKYHGDAARIERALQRDRFSLNEASTFAYLYRHRHAPDIGEKIDKALEHIEESNKAKLRGVFRNISFNSSVNLGNAKERNPMLRHLLEDFAELDLRPSNLPSSDVIGDAYEYMIAQFASDAGKKGGEFFTPSMVSELMARLVQPQANDRIYDPTCGSGSLLIRAFKKVPRQKAQIYGQERNAQTHSLCRMNMFLHGIDDAKIAWGDTLSNPLHLDDRNHLMKFQVVVANPPFSLDKWAMGFASQADEKFKMDASLDPHHRFDWGVPPKSKGDFAFVQHMLYSLDEGGRMAIVLPHGVLFRGAAEGKIRRQIVEMNLLDAVVGLPENLFYGTGIPAAILVCRKNRQRQEVLFIDASSEQHYRKEKTRNILTEAGVQRIIEAYHEYATSDKLAYRATPDEIKENDFNLNIPRYVDTFEPEAPVDMAAVQQRIAALEAELSVVKENMAGYLENLGL